ncbi:isocitrate dehydrogenase [Ornatilinea apprima]|uniref:Isocitrate dehydrogenase [NADP] n=1 Tax=Ornatilinea apprima TaxID=1134406 RepID=A0A0P6XV45_9CHLR|nr:NADP-dependent isocitrate dehydrogenase [Ornatilinea apprima]KPL77332.1 isocitrate dehydrogenase [Ornatilinea apprima]
MSQPFFSPPFDAQPVTKPGDQLLVPDYPIIPFIEGDGIGRDIWRAARRVMDAAVEVAYGKQRKLGWMEVLAGEKANQLMQAWLPLETLEAFKTYKIGIKGPLTTPVGGGMRSLNVTLRKELDLFVCQRPVRYYQGVPSPVKNPQDVDMVVFRENTEDIYTGIEFQSGSEENERFLTLLKEHFPAEYAKIRFPGSSSVGIKPISKEGSQRLVRAAIRWALENQRRRVTLAHKGNIMKFTEGSFRAWGYDLAESEFGGRVYTQRAWEQTRKQAGEEAANAEMQRALSDGKLYVNDMIADIVFEATITRPRDFDVIATMNLNGDYLSDGLAAQVGGVGIAPGANINYDSGVAVFEATHGTAPLFADKDMANPCSLLLSGEMMLRYLGWREAAGLVVKGIEGALTAKTVTFDFERLMDGAVRLSTSEFATAIIQHMR